MSFTTGSAIDLSPQPIIPPLSTEALAPPYLSHAATPLNKLEKTPCRSASTGLCKG
jgi:hypothetical protein